MTFRSAAAAFAATVLIALPGIASAQQQRPPQAGGSHRIEDFTG